MKAAEGMQAPTHTDFPGDYIPRDAVSLCVAELTLCWRTTTLAVVEDTSRLCYFGNDGFCDMCAGWDCTIVDGEIVRVPCAHGCTEGVLKPPQQVTDDHTRRKDIS